LPVSPPEPDPFVAWFRDHAATLSTLDPDGPLDDLEPLREIVGDARVLAVGENAHFVREFGLARRCVSRFLAERCGFTTFAFEFGFSEAFALDPWLQGEGNDDDLAGLSPAAARWGAGELMHWLRRHNTRSSHPLRFVGVDLPEAGGTLRPALDPVADHLADVDPDALPILRAVLSIADQMASESGAGAGPAWAILDVAGQNAMTAGLARLLMRLRALEPLLVARSSQRDHDVAVRRVEAHATPTTCGASWRA